MKIPFFIYLRAVGIYALITLPTLLIPIMYIISLFYVVVFGWFAWLIFTVTYLIAEKTTSTLKSRMALLYIAIPIAVVFAFQMLGVSKTESSIWLSGPFLFFPLGAIISGWMALYSYEGKIKAVIDERFEHAVDDSGLFD